MSKEVEFNTYAFDQVVAQLSKITGKGFEKIIKYEASRMLGIAMKTTRAASAKKIDYRYTYKDSGTPHPKLVTYAYLNGKRRIVRRIRKKGAFVERGRGKNRKKVWDPNKTNPDWRPLQAELLRLKTSKKARRGMSKASWLYIAKRAKLGKIEGGGTKYILKALGLMTSNMKARLNATTGGQLQEYFLELKNYARVPMISAAGKRNGAGGFMAFSNAFHGRTGYFYSNMSKGVFEKASTIATKYKGFELTPLQNVKTSDPVR